MKHYFLYAQYFNIIAKQAALDIVFKCANSLQFKQLFVLCENIPMSFNKSRARWNVPAHIPSYSKRD